MELPNISIDIRKNVLKELVKYVPLEKARQVEHYCHTNRCQNASFYGIPCWSYNSKLLFSTDRPEEHIRYAGFAYTSNCLKMLSLLETNVDIRKEGAQTIWYADTSTEKFKMFQDQYYQILSEAKKVLSEKAEVTVGLFTCAKCKSKDIDTEQKQTRSADEPMTLFCACNRCGTRWVMK